MSPGDSDTPVATADRLAVLRGQEQWAPGRVPGRHLPQARCSHFLEEIPVGDDLQLLEDEEDAAADEEGLVPCQRLVEQEQVALAGGAAEQGRERARQCHSQGSAQPPHGTKSGTYLTARVTSANCMRWYFLKSSTVGMWP